MFSPLIHQLPAQVVAELGVVLFRFGQVGSQIAGLFAVAVGRVVFDQRLGQFLRFGWIHCASTLAIISGSFPDRFRIVNAC